MVNFKYGNMAGPRHLCIHMYYILKWVYFDIFCNKITRNDNKSNNNNTDIYNGNTKKIKANFLREKKISKLFLKGNRNSRYMRQTSTSICSTYYRDAPDLARTLVSIKSMSAANSDFYADVIYNHEFPARSYLLQAVPLVTSKSHELLVGCSSTIPLELQRNRNLCQPLSSTRSTSFLPRPFRARAMQEDYLPQCSKYDF